jgi:hypothetical protein
MALRDLLDTDAVVAHERRYLRHRHHHLLWLTRLGVAIHPVLAPMLRRVATTLGTAALRSTPPTNRALRPAGTLDFGARPGPARCPAAS